MRRRWATGLALALAAIAAPSFAAGGLDTDLRNNLIGVEGYFFTDLDGGQRGEPTRVGDFDGDGHMDAVGAPFFASMRNQQGDILRSNNGSVEVFFGDGRLVGKFDTSMQSARRLTIRGARDASQLGLELASGDFDGDGIDDLAMGSFQGLHAEEAGARGSGEVVVLFGRREWGMSVRELDIANLPEDQRAFFLVGQSQYDRLGAWLVMTDLDQDGHMEMVTGADLSNGPAASRPDCGMVAIYWGQAGAIPRRVRVGEEDSATSLTLIYGVDQGDQFGATLWVDDWNGDDRPDLAVGAGVTRSGLAPLGGLPYSATGGGDGPSNSRQNAGDTHLLWDARRLKALRTLDLAQPLPNGIHQTIIYGETRNSYAGEELNSGDIDGDGIVDLLVGALGADIFVGRCYIVWGSDQLPDRPTIDLLATGDPGFVRLIGRYSAGLFGDTINAFDSNGDGIEDLFLATPQGSVPSSRSENGVSHVVYGGPQWRTISDFELATLDTGGYPQLRFARVVGPDTGDLLSYSTWEGDMDGDGYGDYLPNCMRSDGLGNAFLDAGEFYAISGFELARRAIAPAPVFLRSDGFGSSWIEWQVAQDGVMGDVLGYEIAYEQSPGSNAEPIVVEVDDATTIALQQGQAAPLYVRSVVESPDGVLASEWVTTSLRFNAPAPRPARIDILRSVIGLRDLPAWPERNGDTAVDIGDAMTLIH